jgi:hypothetical protein
MRTISSDKILDLKASVRNLISIVRLLAVSGNVSIQNAESVTEALDGLVDFIQASQKSSLAESILISREDLVDVHDMVTRSERTHADTQKDKLTAKSLPADPAHSKDGSGISGVSDMSSRTLSIFEVLRSGKELGIREIASNLPEYSEKMIQRELADMVRLGKVKKEGLKRWSRYSIIV